MAFESRAEYWKELPSYDSSFHFRWQPISKGIRFDQLSASQKQMVNHFEFHYEITTKDNLFRNFLKYTHETKLNPFLYVPLTFIINVNEFGEVVNYKEFVKCHKILSKLKKNYEKKLKEIGFAVNKKLVITEKAELNETHFAGKNIWIFKPTELNRGQGVIVFDTLPKFFELIKEYSKGPIDEEMLVNKTKATKSPKNKIRARSFVIQKYIEKPLLIYNRKFDIRCWALVTHEMKLYFFKEGYIRTSSSEYTVDDVEKKDIHLTNNAIQKYCTGYSKFEDGNQMSFPMFQVIVI